MSNGSATSEMMEPTHRRWLMLFIAFLIQNLAIGLTFGSVGLLMDPLAQELRGSHSLLSISIAAVMLANGLLGPLVGLLVDRWSLRYTMMCGALLGAIGFFVAARSTSVLTYVLSFALLVGPAYAMTGLLSANKIISLWFPHTIGRAGSVVNVPLLPAMGPPLFAIVIAAFGWRSLLDLFALVYIGLILLCSFIRIPSGPVTVSSTSGFGDERVVPPKGIATGLPLNTPLFWILALTYGLTLSSGITGVTHAAPNALDHGLSLTQASLLTSIIGVCGILGNFLFGWLCDWLTPQIALIIDITLLGLMWLLLANADNFYLMAISAAGIGMGAAGLVPIFIAILNRVYDPKQFGRIFGIVGLIALPFSFGAAPLAGLIFDVLGSYQLAFYLQACVCVVALIMVGVIYRELKEAILDSPIG